MTPPLIQHAEPWMLLAVVGLEPLALGMQCSIEKGSAVMQHQHITVPLTTASGGLQSADVWTQVQVGGPSAAKSDMEFCLARVQEVKRSVPVASSGNTTISRSI